MYYTYQCDQLTFLYLSVPLLVYFNKLQNSSEIATSGFVRMLSDSSHPPADEGWQKNTFYTK